MNNNDILRRLRYTFDFNDPKLLELFKSGGEPVTRAELIEWMKKEDELMIILGVSVIVLKVLYVLCRMMRVGQP